LALKEIPFSICAYLAGQSPCEQSFSRAWWAYQQNPLRELGTRFMVLARVLQEINDLLKLAFKLVNPF
jgi:hypothetical protein